MDRYNVGIQSFKVPIPCLFVIRKKVGMTVAGLYLKTPLSLSAMMIFLDPLINYPGDLYLAAFEQKRSGLLLSAGTGVCDDFYFYRRHSGRSILY